MQAHLARQESLQNEFAEYFESKARKILAGGEARIETTTVDEDMVEALSPYRPYG